MSHPIKLLVDFDGVIHAYTSKWTRADEILDGPVDGAFDWIRQMHADGAKISIFTARLSNEPLNESDGPRNHVIVETNLRYWFLEHGLEKEHVSQLEFVTGKPHATLYIDDRASCFRGKFPGLAEIQAHQQWNKHPADQVLQRDVTAAVRAARARGLDWRTIEHDVRSMIEIQEIFERNGV